jgi:cytochrome c peroxidase
MSTKGSLQRKQLTLVAFALFGWAGCQQVDSVFCAKAGCGWSEQEWKSLTELADLPAAPPPDRSNKYAGNAGAELLGQKFFFDTRWAGNSTQVDVLKRPVAYARTSKGTPTNLSCASCHDMHRGGIDTESIPGNVSIGAAWADTNALSVFNSGFYTMSFWNGRADSLWAQAAAVIEGTNMNGNRLNNLWMISEYYRDQFNAVFSDWQLPVMGPRATIEALVETNGKCKLSGTTCPAACVEVKSTDGKATGCFPRFPLNGKPGAKAGCQPDDMSEPFWDAFDCMDVMDQEITTRTLVNYSKAIAAYEYKLVSRDSPFDRYVSSVKAGEDRDYTAFSAAAERGARVFIGRGACVDCHRTSLFSDNNFYNIGIEQTGTGVPTEADCPAGGVCDCQTIGVDSNSNPKIGNNCLPWGALDGFDKITRNKFRRELKWSDDMADDTRKSVVSVGLDPKLKGSYRTPTLRDVALTAPYMHNGSLPTLEAVVDHYDRGGSSFVPGARSPRIKPLMLTAGEKADLVAFLESLTGAPMPSELLVAPPK